jgi:hypothetical protein
VLVELLERVQFFLKRLGVHTRITPTEDLLEKLVTIMAEVLSILAIATKEVQQSRTGKLYLPVQYKLIQRTASKLNQKHCLGRRILRTLSRSLMT